MATPDTLKSAEHGIARGGVPPHRLVCLSQVMKGLSFSIESANRSEFVLGRLRDSNQADLTFNDISVSSRHCALCATPDGHYALRDLGSLNGTCINGRRIGKENVLLRDGDVLALGDFEVMYRASGKYHYTVSDRQVVTLADAATSTQHVPLMHNLTPFPQVRQTRFAHALIAVSVSVAAALLFVLYKLVVEMLY